MNFLQNILKSENQEIKRFNNNIKNGRREMLTRDLTKNNIDVNSETKNGETPAYCAISTNKPWEFELLLINDLDLKKPIKGPKSVVWQSVKDCVMSYHNVTMLKSLEEFGEKIDYKSEYAKKCMFDACKKGDINYLEFMIEKNGFDGSWRDESGASLLLSFMRTMDPNKITPRHMAIMDKFMDSPEQINAVLNPRSTDEILEEIESRRSPGDIPAVLRGHGYTEKDFIRRDDAPPAIQEGESPTEIFANWFPKLANKYRGDLDTQRNQEKALSSLSVLRDKILKNADISSASHEVLIDLINNTKYLNGNDQNNKSKNPEDLMFKRNQVNEFDANSETFSMAAARKNDVNLFSRAVNNFGADIKIKNKDGFDSGDIAKKAGSFDVSVKIKSINKKAKNNDGLERG